MLSRNIKKSPVDSKFDASVCTIFDASVDIRVDPVHANARPIQESFSIVVHKPNDECEASIIKARTK